MKKIRIIDTIVLVFIATLMFSCSGGGDEATDSDQAPGKVTALTYPTNNLLCIDNTIEFQWGASTDPNGDVVFYVLEIATKNDFSDAETFTLREETTKSITLERGRAHFWRVLARDSKNFKSDYSEVYQFYTEGDAEENHLPFSPVLVSPANESSDVSGTSVDLRWNAADVDEDALTYDVYFDTANPPVSKVGDNQTDNKKNVSLSAATTYYWKVIVKDGKGGESVGQIWNFETN